MERVFTQLGERFVVPQDIRRLRQSVLDFHRKEGYPVVLKHKWNEQDVKEGKAQYCQYCRDINYKQGRDRCPYCFGTGYLGGYDNGVITFITIGDATEDVFKISQEGLLIRDKHPVNTAPWKPTMGDGDILITGKFHPRTLDIIELGERYVLREVTPVAPRGTGFDFRGLHQLHNQYLVAQNFQMDKIPETDMRYQIPIDWVLPSDAPIPPPQPYGGDVEDLEIPVVASTHTYWIIHGNNPAGDDPEVFIEFPVD